MTEQEFVRLDKDIRQYQNENAKDANRGRYVSETQKLF